MIGTPKELARALGSENAALTAIQTQLAEAQADLAAKRRVQETVNHRLEKELTTVRAQLADARAQIAEAMQAVARIGEGK
jgi:hypothetical protein